MPADGAARRAGDAWLGDCTWLFSQSQPGLRRLLDLTTFGWPSLTETRDGLEIAATCTLAASVVSGLKDLTVLNTTASEFWGYPKDPYTTRFRPESISVTDWAAAFATARATVLETFAATYTYSLQQMRDRFADPHRPSRGVRGTAGAA